MRPLSQIDTSCFDLVAEVFGAAFREAWDFAVTGHCSSLDALREETRRFMGISLWQTRDEGEADDAR